MQIPLRKMMLVKGQGRPTYLFSKDPQIRLWYKRPGHASNAKVVEVFQLNNRIDITLEDDLPTKNLSSDLGIDNKDECKNLGQIFTVDNKHERLLPLMAIINDPDNCEIKKLYNLYIKSKYTKIIRYKKMTLTTKKL